MKRLLKKLYMIFFHSFLLLRVKNNGKNFFVGRRALINKPQYIELNDNVRIGNDCRLSFFDKFNGEHLEPYLSFGKNVYIGSHFSVLCADKVVIEDDVLIASYVMISSENHGIDPDCNLPYGKQSLTRNSVRICKGVWLGEKVSVLPGVTIGEKSIIGTASVVTKNIPSFSIAVGNPAKVIKKYNFSKKVWEKV